jgi:cyclase
VRLTGVRGLPRPASTPHAGGRFLPGRRTYPTLTYADNLILYHGGREFRFLSVPGDAEGTTVLYLPKEKVLLTGDVVSYPIPYISTPPGRHVESLRMLAGLDVDVIVPGHGPAFRDKNFLNLEAELLETVAKGVREALQKGRSHSTKCRRP